jgi:hypothetical protein
MRSPSGAQHADRDDHLRRIDALRDAMDCSATITMRRRHIGADRLCGSAAWSPLPVGVMTMPN